MEVLDINLDSDFIQSLTPLAKLVTLNEATQPIKIAKIFSQRNHGHVAVIGGRHGMIVHYWIAKAAYRSGWKSYCSRTKCGY